MLDSTTVLFDRFWAVAYDTIRNEGLSSYHEIIEYHEIIVSLRYSQKEKYEEISKRLHAKCEHNLEIVMDEEKGRGIITTVPREKGDFLLEYAGELITYEKAQRREALYGNMGCCYMYYFDFKSTKYW